MDEEKAWLNFTNTGKIEDYLLYNKCKHECVETMREGIADANKVKWTSDNGGKFRGA